MKKWNEPKLESLKVTCTKDSASCPYGYKANKHGNTGLVECVYGTNKRLLVCPGGYMQDGNKPGHDKGIKVCTYKASNYAG